jgi:hypothetical protein
MLLTPMPKHVPRAGKQRRSIQLLLEKQYYSLAWIVYIGPQGTAVDPCSPGDFSPITRWATSMVSQQPDDNRPIPTGIIEHIPKVSLGVLLWRMAHCANGVLFYQVRKSD